MWPSKSVFWRVRHRLNLNFTSTLQAKNVPARPVRSAKPLDRQVSQNCMPSEFNWNEGWCFDFFLVQSNQASSTKSANSWEIHCRSMIRTVGHVYRFFFPLRSSLTIGREEKKKKEKKYIRPRRTTMIIRAISVVDLAVVHTQLANASVARFDRKEKSEKKCVQ